MLIEYEYNIQNIVSGEEITVSYAYDGTGTRIGKDSKQVSTGQIWNNGNVIAEYGTKGIKVVYPRSRRRNSKGKRIAQITTDISHITPTETQQT